MATDPAVAQVVQQLLQAVWWNAIIMINIYRLHLASFWCQTRRSGELRRVRLLSLNAGLELMNRRTLVLYCCRKRVLGVPGVRL